MSILQPLTNKIYGISSKSARLNQLYKQYCHDRGQIEVQGQVFNKNLDTLKSMIVYNSALLIITSQITMTDDKYGEWLKNTQPFTMGQPSTSEVAEVFAFVADTTAGILVGKVVKNLATALKNKLFSSAAEDASSEVDGAGDEIADALADAASDALESGLSITGEEAADSLAEGATEAAIEGATAGSLGAAALGGAIVLALGVDAIVSAVESAKEAHQLTDETNKLQKALDGVDTYLNALTTKESQVKDMIVKQEQRFLKNVALLNKIQPCKAFYNYKPGVDSAGKFLSSMHGAASQYFYLQAIRTNWVNMTTNKPDLTWDTFKMVMELERPQSLSEDQVEEFLNYASRFSASMKASSGAKAAASNN